MNAIAQIKGGPLAPKLSGTVIFKDTQGGVEIFADVSGLPNYEPGSDDTAPIGPHGFHIHNVGNCQTGSQDNPFPFVDGHWNPTNQPHGNHYGDLPVLFSNNGTARMSVFTDKFKVSDILGKSIIIHQNPDDFRTQPSGASGKPLGCGVINLYIEQFKK